MIARTMTPKSENNSTMPSHAENGARARAMSRSDSASGMLVHQFQRFDQAWIAHREEGGFTDDAQINKSERRAHADERDEIPNAQVQTGAMQRGQNDQIHVEHLHAEDPGRDPTKLMRMFLDRLQ